jgi:hypothetical protein
VPDKEREVLLGDGSSKKKRPLRSYLSAKKGGIGGSIGKIDRQVGPDIELKWKAGRYRGTPGATGPRKSPSKLHRKSRSGFRFEIKF